MPDLIKPMLRVNGLPIAISAAQPPMVSYDETAMVTERSARGVLVPSRRNLTRVLTAKTAPYTWPDAYAIKALVEGQAAAASFDSAAFALNRAVNASITGNMGLNTASFISPPSSLSAAAGASMVWSNASIGAWLASSLGCTICFWINMPNNGSGFPIVTLSKSGASDGGLVVSWTAGGGLTFSYPSMAAISANLPINGDWHLVTAVARDTSMSRYNTLSLYVDGVLQSAGGAPLSGFLYPSRDTLQVGPLPSGTSCGLDDLLVYPFPLTDAQVAGMYLSQSINAPSSAGAKSPTPGEQHTARYAPQVWVSGDGIGDAMLAVGRVVGTQLQAVHRDPVTSELLVNGMTLDLSFYEAGAPR